MLKNISILAFDAMKNLLKISIIFSFLGIFLLLLITNLSQPQEISSYNELELNSYVSVQGKIVSIASFEDFKIIKLKNNLTLTCDNCNFHVNKTIQAVGKVTEYKNQKQIQALRINLKIKDAD